MATTPPALPALGTASDAVSPSVQERIAALERRIDSARQGTPAPPSLEDLRTLRLARAAARARLYELDRQRLAVLTQMTERAHQDLAELETPRPSSPTTSNCG